MHGDVATAMETRPRSRSHVADEPEGLEVATAQVVTTPEPGADAGHARPAPHGRRALQASPARPGTAAQKEARSELGRTKGPTHAGSEAGHGREMGPAQYDTGCALEKKQSAAPAGKLNASASASASALPRSLPATLDRAAAAAVRASLSRSAAAAAGRATAAATAASATRSYASRAIL